MEILKRDLDAIADMKCKDSVKELLVFDAKRYYVARNYGSAGNWICGKCNVMSTIGDTMSWHWSGHLFHLKCLPNEV